jgi:hypothetical protein
VRVSQRVFARALIQQQGEPTIITKLAEFDITNSVMKTKQDPFVSNYIDIYCGVWNIDTARVFQLAVAIKAVRPDFDLLSTAQERKNFEDVRKFKLLCPLYVY